MSQGGWGERKRKHTGHDGKVKDRREASAILAIVELSGELEQVSNLNHIKGHVEIGYF